MTAPDPLDVDSLYIHCDINDLTFATTPGHGRKLSWCSTRIEEVRSDRQ